MADPPRRKQSMRAAWAKSDGQSLWEHTLAVMRYAVSLCDDRRLRGVLVRAAWYHDLGKLAQGFQRMIRGEGQWHFRHEVLSALAYLAEHQPLGPLEQLALYAILTHHRDLDDGELLRQLHQEELLRQRLEELPAGLFPPVSEMLSGARWLLEQILDRDRRFPLVSEHTWVRGWLIAADHAASAGLAGAVQVEREHQRPQWRQFQREASAVAGNLLLEAPTGAGKTDAALLWYQRNREHPRQRLFYVLPYRASIEAMRQRLEAIYGASCVAALHGRDLEYAYLRYLGDVDAEQAQRRAKQDVQANRLAHKPIKVLTPQQILKYLLGIPRFEIGIAEMTRALFVFDEVHAYDAHMLALLLETMALLRQLGASLMVMTATLPDFLRALVEEALGTHARVCAYDDPELPQHRHRLRVLAQPLERCIPLIRQDLADGKRVLVVCNRIGQAQEIYQQFSDFPPRRLLHSRFTYRDRGAIEREILNRSTQPQLLVATQVVEVSLDISYDTCYTEVAPVDDLLQRFGRVNRTGAQSEPAAVHVCTVYEPQRVGHVYDLQRLERTAQTAPDGEVLTPDVTWRWLNAVYRDFTQTERERFERVRRLFRSHLEQLQPYHSVSVREEAVLSLYRTVDAVPESLLGEYHDLLSRCGWLEARTLLVPVATGDKRLRLLKGGGYCVARTYDAELGLLGSQEE